MNFDRWVVGALGLWMAACSSDGGHTTGSKDPGDKVPDDTKPSYDFSDENVPVDSDLVIASGTTMRVGPGVTFTAASGAKIQIEGTLIVEGSADSPVSFTSAGTPAPDSWAGIEIASGGRLELTHAGIEGAQYGVHALPGSSYAVDFAEVGTSFKAMVLESDGSVDHSTFHATTPPTISLAADVTIDDPNGTMTIMGASPTVTNTLFEGNSPVTDMVRIGGESTPTFDHVHLKGAHCAFHNFGATNNAPIVRNSIIETMSYAVMAFSSGAVFENTNFVDDMNVAGFCYGATAESPPIFKGSYFAAGEATFDASCAQVGTTATDTVTEPVAGAGPVGL